MTGDAACQDLKHDIGIWRDQLLTLPLRLGRHRLRAWEDNLSARATERWLSVAIDISKASVLQACQAACISYSSRQCRLEICPMTPTS